MQKPKSWFIAVYGTIFASLFGIVFLIMVIYRWNGYAYFPDWNSFLIGFSGAISGSGYGDFLQGFNKAFQYLSDILQKLVSFGQFGNAGWAWSTISTFSILMGGGPLMVTFIAMGAVAGLYVAFLTVPLVSSVAFIIGASIGDNFIPGTQPIVSYYSGEGYDLSEWTFVPVVLARCFA